MTPRGRQCRLQSNVCGEFQNQGFNFSGTSIRKSGHQATIEMLIQLESTLLRRLAGHVPCCHGNHANNSPPRRRVQPCGRHRWLRFRLAAQGGWLRGHGRHRRWRPRVAAGVHLASGARRARRRPRCLSSCAHPPRLPGFEGRRFRVHQQRSRALRRQRRDRASRNVHLPQRLRSGRVRSRLRLCRTGPDQRSAARLPRFLPDSRRHDLLLLPLLVSGRAAHASSSSG